MDDIPELKVAVQAGPAALAAEPILRPRTVCALFRLASILWESWEMRALVRCVAGVAALRPDAQPWLQDAIAACADRLLWEPTNSGLDAACEVAEEMAAQQPALAPFQLPTDYQCVLGVLKRGKDERSRHLVARFLCAAVADRAASDDRTASGAAVAAVAMSVVSECIVMPFCDVRDPRALFLVMLQYPALASSADWAREYPSAHLSRAVCAGRFAQLLAQARPCVRAGAWRRRLEPLAAWARRRVGRERVRMH